MATLANVVRVSVAVAGLVSAVGLASTHAANSELKRERASAGSVLAELSYRQVSDPYLRVYDLRLRVWR